MIHSIRWSKSHALSLRLRIYNVLLGLRSVLKQNFIFGIGNLESRLNSIRSDVLIKIQGNLRINQLGIKTFPLNFKNIQLWRMFSFYIKSKSSNMEQQHIIRIYYWLRLFRFIFRTEKKIHVPYSVFNARSGRNKSQSVRNYKKRGKYRHDDNNKSKQMKYVRLLILCIMLLPIVLLLIK